ncbi:MAG: lysine exporter LysO family protein [Halanaerobiales bacterium]|nr:lysine exporter LysO family protein [Halanaerobiales bacterium]
MTWIIIGAVATGFGLGFFLNDIMIQNLNQISTFALAILLFGIGIDLGGNRKIWQGLKEIGWRIFLVPIAIAIGSIAAAGIGGLLVGLSLNEGTAVGAGFGWYSLSAILISRLYSEEIGAIAFLTNIFRELLTVLMIPFLAKHLGYITSIAPGGATSMDTTLPLIARYTNPQTTLVAFVSGAILSSLVPILVPLLIKM